MPTEERWAKLIQDAVGSNTKVREGLTDDEAMPLMDWGNAYANVLAVRLIAPGNPEPNEDQVNEVAYSLIRLMTRMTWLVTYRDKKEADWLTQTFQMINKLSQELPGANTPVFSDEEIAAWLADHPNHSNGELIKGLMVRLTPPEIAAPPEPTLPAAPLSESALPDAAPAEPTPPAAASPLSNWVFGTSLPGRSKTDKPEPSLPPGEKND